MYWPLLGRKVRGGVSFKFDLDVAKILDALDKIIERFDSNEHRTRWPQANNLVSVRDEAVVDQLDGSSDSSWTSRPRRCSDSTKIWRPCLTSLMAIIDKSRSLLRLS